MQQEVRNFRRKWRVSGPLCNTRAFASGSGAKIETREIGESGSAALAYRTFGTKIVECGLENYLMKALATFALLSSQEDGHILIELKTH